MYIKIKQGKTKGSRHYAPSAAYCNMLPEWFLLRVCSSVQAYKINMRSFPISVDPLYMPVFRIHCCFSKILFKIYDFSFKPKSNI